MRCKRQARRGLPRRGNPALRASAIAIRINTPTDLGERGCNCSDRVKSDGTTRTDGNACTQPDTCQAGVCTGSNNVTCTALDDCRDVGACNPTDGQCSDPPKSDGTDMRRPAGMSVPDPVGAGRDDDVPLN